MGEHAFDVAILGGGPAGYSAAIYAARSGLSAAVFEQGMPGGQITTTDVIENYPGFTSISGAELGDKFREHAEAAGAETVYAMVNSVERMPSGGYRLASGSDSYESATLILATGAVPRTAGFVGEDTFRGRGISYCATCDGMFYRGKKVFVIGGGNAACEEALFLSQIASEVVMVVRRDQFRAPQGVVDKLLERPNVSVAYSRSITAVSGGTFISQVTFRNNETGEEYTEEYEEGTIGIFVFAGTKPVVELFSDLVEIANDGGVVTDEGMATKTPGLFAAGDVRSKRLRQVITAAADGAIAATSAYHYIRG